MLGGMVVVVRGGGGEMSGEQVAEGALRRIVSHSPNAPPRTAVASKMVALNPASSQVFAVTSPAGPAPMTATLRTACGRELSSTGSGSSSYSWLGRERKRGGGGG